MARQAMWVHGNAVTLCYPGGGGISPYTPNRQMNMAQESGNWIAWTDIVGLHRDEGVTFRGRFNATNKFMVSIPTPCWRDGARAMLVMVGVIFESDVHVQITRIQVHDGRRQIKDIPMSNLSGNRPDLIGNVNRFDFPGIEVFFGLNVTFDVFFSQEGNITFNAVGVDFEV
jgi:hypothetical protein